MNQEFYDKCSEILGIPHQYHTPYAKKTRWNVRILGNGRFEGFGVIKCFSPSCIYVITKDETKLFKSDHEVFEYLECVNQKHQI